MERETFLKDVTLAVLPHYLAGAASPQVCCQQAHEVATCLWDMIYPPAAADVPQVYQPGEGDEYYYIALSGRSLKVERATWQERDCDYARQSIMGVFPDRDTCYAALCRLNESLLS